MAFEIDELYADEMELMAELNYDDEQPSPPLIGFLIY